MTTLSTSAFFERANLSMSALRKQAEGLQAQVSSGEKLSRPSDDPVAAARLRELARQDQLSTENLANANRAMADLTLADSAIAEIGDNLIRAQELAVQAASDILSDSQRAIIGEQLSNIRDNLVALANLRDSAGHALFGGETSGDAYGFDVAGNPVYTGTASSGELPLGQGQSVMRGVTGPEFLSFDHAGSPTDLFAVIGGLADALKSGVPDPGAAARDALGALDSGLERLTTTQTIVGARMNWVDLNVARHERLGEMRAAEESYVGGADIADTITRLQQAMTVLEASQASFVRLANMSLFNMLG